ncbi:MAG: amidohydrolase family protein [Thermoguttaceae bacterium]
MRIHRRQLLASAAAAAAWAGGVAPCRAQPATLLAKPTIPIVDTHQHLWDLSKLRLPWLKGPGPLNRSYLMKDYLEATAGLGVVKAVYMEVDVDPADQLKEAQYILDICRRKDSPTCAAVIGGRPGAEDFRQYIERFRQSPFIKGVRQILPGPGSGRPFFLDRPFLEGIRLLGELGMSFDLCIPPAGLSAAARLVELCPGTRFILDHCGNADVKMFLPAARQESAQQAETARQAADRWRRDIDRLARCKNLVCKISGIVASVPKAGWGPEDLAPIINHCLDAFGPDRVMFASDWPVCTLGASLRQWVEALRQLVRPRSQADQRKLWGENAVAFYGLGQ